MRCRRALLLCAALAACEPPPPPGVEPEEALPLTVGRPEAGAFTPLANGTVLELEPGSQAGYHLSLAVTLAGFPLGQVVTVEREARRVDSGALVSLGRSRHPLAEEAPLPLRLFLCPTPLGISVDGEPLLLRVTAVGEDGTRAEGTATLTAACPEGQVSKSCAQICRG